MNKKMAGIVAFSFMLGVLTNSLSSSVGMRADLVSRYTWRGFDLNPYDEPAIQPAAVFKFGDTGLAIAPWISLSFKDHEVDEFRLTLSYQRRIGAPLVLEVGIIHYGWYLVPQFRFGDDTSHEAFFSLALDRLFFRPEFTVFYDFANGDGFYILLRSSVVARPLKLFRADLSASLGYNGGQWLAEGEKPGFADLNLDIAIPLAWGGLRIVPAIGFTQVMLEALGKGNHFRFSVSASWGAAVDWRFR